MTFKTFIALLTFEIAGSGEKYALVGCPTHNYSRQHVVRLLRFFLNCIHLGSNNRIPFVKYFPKTYLKLFFGKMLIE